MIQFVIMRHGESQWNLENRFTGWVDVDLTPHGVAEAQRAGELLRAAGWQFDVCYTSVLKRAIKTLNTALESIDQLYLPVVHSWRLNERHYGALAGLNKTETAQKYGEAQVKIWRRSYDVPPPPLAQRDTANPRYAKLRPEDVPLTECLKDTVARITPLWQDSLAPALRSGKRVLIAAHGNSLRALIQLLENLPESEIVELNIPTAQPILYTLTDDLKPVSREYLGDPAQIAAALAAVASQGQVANTSNSTS